MFLFPKSPLFLLLLAAPLMLGNPATRSAEGISPNLPVLAQTAEERKAEADRLLEQGNEQLEAKEFQAAFQLFEQVLKIYREINDRSGEAYTLLGLASTYPFTSLDNFDRVVSLCLEALDIFRSLNDPEGEVDALAVLRHQVMDEALFLGNHAYEQEGLEHILKYIPVFQSIGDRIGEGQAFARLGYFYLVLDQFPQGTQAYQQALAIYRELGNQEEEINVLTDLGYRYLQKEKNHAAINVYQQVLSIYQETGERQQESDILLKLSEIYGKIEDFSQSLEYQQQALNIFNELGNSPGQSIFLSLGFLYRKLGQPEQSLESYKKLLDLNSNNREALIEIGNTYLTMDRLQQALSFHQQAIQVSSIEDEGIFMRLGNTYLAEGYLQQALIFHQQAIEIDRHGDSAWNNSNNRAVKLRTLGETYTSSGHLLQALEFYKKSFSIVKKQRNGNIRYLPPNPQTESTAT